MACGGGDPPASPPTMAPWRHGTMPPPLSRLRASPPLWVQGFRGYLERELEEPMARFRANLMAAVGEFGHPWYDTELKVITASGRVRVVGVAVAHCPPFRSEVSRPSTPPHTRPPRRPLPRQSIPPLRPPARHNLTPPPHPPQGPPPQPPSTAQPLVPTAPRHQLAARPPPNLSPSPNYHKGCDLPPPPAHERKGGGHLPVAT